MKIWSLRTPNITTSRTVITFAAEHAPIGPGTSVGGKSGGVSNSDLIRELETVALEHVRNCHDREMKAKTSMMILASSP